MDDCIFCKIINKEISSKIVYEDDKVIAFEDINSQAPVHILVVTKSHYDDFMSMVGKNNIDDINSVFNGVKKVVENKGLEEGGFRLVINNGRQAGQAVDHIHIHILSGRRMNWPPG